MILACSLNSLRDSVTVATAHWPPQSCTGVYGVTSALDWGSATEWICCILSATTRAYGALTVGKETRTHHLRMDLPTDVPADS